MAQLPWNVMNKIRSNIRRVLGHKDYSNYSYTRNGKVVAEGSFDTIVTEDFFTFDHDTQQIVCNTKIDGYHFIFDSDGNLIKHHRD